MKRALLTPGPTSVPPEVLDALAEPVLHHRSPDFATVFTRTLERLRAVFRTENDVLVHTASGTGAFESAIVNLCSAGESILCVSAGEFGERWVALTTAYGLDVQRLAYPWGGEPTPDDLRAAIADTGAGVVVLVHSETSTGVVVDLEPLVAVCNDAGVVSVVDAISALGAVPLETDAWGIDVVVTGSQKALQTPPGLAFTSISARAWERAASATLPRFYFDWRKLRAAQAKGSTAFTPAVSLVVALDASLGLILDAGLDSAFDRHVALGRATRAGVKALGLELYSPDEDRSAVLTAALTPEGVDAVELRLALRDRHGIQIAGGHGDLVSRLFRIGHIGWVSIDDIAGAFDAITTELQAAGVDVEPGVAADAARNAHDTVRA